MNAPRIFVSYRRDDVAHAAGRLAVSLQERGVGEVFVDVSIGIGQNFVQRIREEIAGSDVVLVLIGRNWLGATGDDGRRRIDNERDWVHLEVRTALERGVVVPVLLDGARLPDADDLPEPLRGLLDLQAGSMSASSWERDVTWLAEQLAPWRSSRTPTFRPADPAQGDAATPGGDAAIVTAASEPNADLVAGWTPAAAADLYGRLVAAGNHVQAATILAAVRADGWCDRSTVYQLGRFADSRTLKGFTRPVAVALQRMEQEGILPPGAANPMQPTYDSADGTQTVDGFRIPEALVGVFSRGLVGRAAETHTVAGAGRLGGDVVAADSDRASQLEDGVGEHLRQLKPLQPIADLITRLAEVRGVRSEHRGYVSIAPILGRGIALYVHRSRISIALPPQRAEEAILSFPHFTQQRKSPATTYVMADADSLRNSFDGALGLALEAIDWRSKLDRTPSIPMGASRAKAHHGTSSDDVVIVAARSAYAEYLEASAYVCQPGRSFRASARRVGFYFDWLLRREVPAILHTRDAVPWDLDHSDLLRRRGEEHDAAVARLIEISFQSDSIWFGKRPSDRCRNFKVLLLTPPRDERTMLLPEPLHHGGPSAFTMGQRYVDEEHLLGARSTDDL